MFVTCMFWDGSYVIDLIRFSVILTFNFVKIIIIIIIIISIIIIIISSLLLFPLSKLWIFYQNCLFSQIIILFISIYLFIYYFLLIYL